MPKNKEMSETKNNTSPQTKIADTTDYHMAVRPNFFVIGVVKGGTTSLYHYLDQHPEVFVPRIKETNHFAAADINEKHFLHQYALDVRIDLDKYIASGMREPVHIAHVNEPRHYSALFSGVRGQKAVGEVSNSYMICPSAAAAIHRFNPEAKIIAVLRNPVSRAWSQYLMNLRESKTTCSDFLQEVKVDYEVYPKGWGANHQYLELGMYAKQLAPYFRLFGESRIHLIYYEAYRQEPAGAMRDLCRFLGIDSNFQFDFTVEKNTASLPRSKALNRFLVSSGVVKALKDITPKHLRSKLASVLYSKGSLPTLQPEHAAWLIDYYRDEVAQLAALTTVHPGIYWKEFAP
jgi:hypothetical protein